MIKNKKTHIIYNGLILYFSLIGSFKLLLYVLFFLGEFFFCFFLLVDLLFFELLDYFLTDTIAEVLVESAESAEPLEHVVLEDQIDDDEDSNLRNYIGGTIVVGLTIVVMFVVFYNYYPDIMEWFTGNDPPDSPGGSPPSSSVSELSNIHLGSEGTGNKVNAAVIGAGVGAGLGSALNGIEVVVETAGELIESEVVVETAGELTESEVLCLAVSPFVLPPDSIDRNSKTKLIQLSGCRNVTDSRLEGYNVIDIRFLDTTLNELDNVIIALTAPVNYAILDKIFDSLSTNISSFDVMFEVYDHFGRFSNKMKITILDLFKYESFSSYLSGKKDEDFLCFYVDSSEGKTVYLMKAGVFKGFVFLLDPLKYPEFKINDVFHIRPGYSIHFLDFKCKKNMRVVFRNLSNYSADIPGYLDIEDEEKYIILNCYLTILKGLILENFTNKVKVCYIILSDSDNNIKVLFMETLGLCFWFDEFSVDCTGVNPGFVERFDLVFNSEPSDEFDAMFADANALFDNDTQIQQQADMNDAVGDFNFMADFGIYANNQDQSLTEASENIDEHEIHEMEENVINENIDSDSESSGVLDALFADAKANVSGIKEKADRFEANVEVNFMTAFDIYANNQDQSLTEASENIDEHEIYDKEDVDSRTNVIMLDDADVSKLIEMFLLSDEPTEESVQFLNKFRAVDDTEENVINENIDEHEIHEINFDGPDSDLGGYLYAWDLYFANLEKAQSDS